MSSHVIKCSVFAWVFLLMACHQREKENIEYNKKMLELSKGVMGKEEYNRVYQQAMDSLTTWCSAKLPEFKYLWSYSYRLDSILCFNSEKNRMITAILVQCDIPTCLQENLHYFYGVKIKKQWYFFSVGTLVVIREHYQSDIHTPVNFQKLHELAMSSMLKGYLKKNKNGSLQINEAFFTAHFEDVGWGDFNHQSHKDTLANGKRFTNKKEYFESIYLRKVRNNWLNEGKK